MQQIAFAKWAHDVRNALGAVAIYVDALHQGAGSRHDQVADSAHALLAKATAMCETVVQQARHGDHALLPASFDIAAVIEQVGDLIATTLPTSVSLRMAVSPPIKVMMDPQDAFRILFNLLHNAAAAVRRSTELTQIQVEAGCTGTQAFVMVADNGPGLPKAVRRELFRPSAASPRGYGLLIARELAERNGCTLTLAETAHGTAFVIEMPLAAVERIAA